MLCMNLFYKTKKKECSYVCHKKNMNYNLLKFNIIRSMDLRLLDEAYHILQSVLIQHYPNVIHMSMIPKEIQIENMMDPTETSSSVLEEHVIDSDPKVLYPKEYPKFAIIGTGIRLPGEINNKDDFWKVMTDKKVITGLIPEDRWDREEWYSKVEKPGTIQTLHGGFIENAFDFDNKYFGISQNEALDATPEQRWLCELTVETVEDANMDMDDFKGSHTGVFVGTSGMDYGSYVFSVPEKITKYTYSGIEPSIHANRVSYLFNLHGPSLSTNTACSSSMTALSIACNSMAAGDCEMALVAGTNFFQAPANGVAYSQLRVVSKKGACRPFDIGADGYARLEGAAMVLLKPYEKAIKDNNRIYATILSTACNEDGKTSSLTTPSSEAQCQLMKRVYSKGHIDPCTIDFVEAHGTGTSVGDPIEARSIGEAYGKVNKANGHPLLPVGSVKGNVGHGEYLSGIVGLIKGALILHKNTIVPQTAFETLNPKIHCDELGIRIADKVEPLPGKGRHRAAVNSFGFGGANANVILEEEPQVDKNNISVLMKRNKKGEIIPCAYVAFFSASNLRLLKETLKKWRTVPKQELLPMLYLNATTRNVLTHRLFIFTKDADEFYDTIRQFIEDEEDSISSGYRATEQFMYIETASDRKKGVTMAFDEPFFSTTSFLRNATFYDTCRDFYCNNSYFADCIDYCDQVLKMISGRSLLEDYGLFQSVKEEEKEKEKEKKNKLREDLLKDPTTTLLINGIIQLGLVALYRYYGISPNAVIGYGAGEIAAAYAAEKIDLKSAVQILYHYGRVLSMVKKDDNLSKVYSILVGCPVGKLSQVILSKLSPTEKELISISGVPSPTQCVLNGEMEILKKIMEQAKTEKIPILGSLMDSFAIHTKKISEAMKEELVKRLTNIKSKPSSIAMFSTTKFSKEGKPYTDALDGQYWWMNMRNPVLYAHSLSQTANFLPTDGKNILEIGLHFDHLVFKSSSLGFYQKDRIYNCFHYEENSSRDNSSNLNLNRNSNSNSTTVTATNYDIRFNQFIRFLCTMYGYNVCQKLKFGHLWETMVNVEGGDRTLQQLSSMHYDLPTRCWNHKYLRKLYKAKRNGLPGDVNIVKTKDVVYLEKMALTASSKKLEEKIEAKAKATSASLKNEGENMESKMMIKSATISTLRDEKKVGKDKKLEEISKKQNNSTPNLSMNTGNSNSNNNTGTSGPVDTKDRSGSSKSIPGKTQMISLVPYNYQKTKNSTLNGNSAVYSSKNLQKYSSTSSLSSTSSSSSSSSSTSLKNEKSTSKPASVLAAPISIPIPIKVSASEVKDRSTIKEEPLKKSVTKMPFTAKKEEAIENKEKEVLNEVKKNDDMMMKATEEDEFWVYENNQYLVDHKVNNQIVFPAAGSVSRALYGYERSRGIIESESIVTLNDLEFVGLTVFQKTVESQLRSKGLIPMKLYEDEDHQFILKQNDGSVISKGTFPPLHSPKESEVLSNFPEFSEVIKSCSTVKGGEGIRKEQIYQRANTIELQYGPQFQLIQHGRSGKKYSYAKIAVREDHAQMICHPAVLDNCFHSIICLGLGCGNRQVLPYKIKRLEMKNGGRFKEGILTCVSQLIYQDLSRVMVNLFIYDDAGEPFMKIDHMEFLIRKLKPIRPLEWYNVLCTEKLEENLEKRFPLSCHHVAVLCDKKQEEEVNRHLVSILSTFNHLSVYLITENHQESIQAILQSGSVPKEDFGMVDVTLLEDASLPTAFLKIQYYVKEGLNFVMGNIRLDHVKVSEDIENLFTASNGVPGMLKAARSESRKSQMFSIQANTVEQFAKGLFAGYLSIEEPDVMVNDSGELQAYRLIHQTTIPSIRSKNFVSEPKLVGHVNRMIFRKTYGIPDLQGSNSSSSSSNGSGSSGRERDKECVIVKVKTISLQNNDVLQNSYPELAEIMKGSSVIECVGTIVNVGSKVKKFKRGDFVFGISFYGDYVPSTYVKIPQDLVFAVDRKDTLKQQQLISSVYAYTVALYLLNEIQANESVLLTTNAVDLMQALVVIAQQKQISIVLDDRSKKYSRSPNPIFSNLFKSQRMIHSDGDRNQCVQQVKAFTNNQGVHYVIDANVKFDHEEVLEACLREGGEYIKVGNLDHHVKKRTTHKVVQMSALSVKQMAPLVREAIEKINKCTVEAIELKSYPLTKMNNATIEIISGRSQGKSCLIMEEEEEEEEKEKEKGRKGEQSVGYECLPGNIFKEDKSYLVTGAFGGVGLRVCLWMQLRGAHHLVLTTSSNPESKKDHPIVKALRQRGAQVSIVKCDISKYDEVEKLFKETSPSLDGVFHFANKFGPKLIRDSGLESFIATYEPKARGALNLHKISQKGYPLSTFVLFSSVLDLLGNTGQIAYGGANAFLGNLVYYRRRQGLSGQCFSLPAMKGSGYLSQWKQEGQFREFSEIIEFLDSEDLPDILDFFIREDVDPCLQLMARFQLNPEYEKHIAPITNVLKYRIHPELSVPALLQSQFPPLKFHKVLEEKEKYILSKYMKTTAITTTTTTTTTTATVNNNTTSTTTTTTSLMSSLSNTRSTSPYSQSQESSNTQRRSYSPTNSNSDDSNSGDSSAGDSSVGDSSTGESSTGGRSSTGYGSVGESIDSEKTLRNSDDKKGNLSKNNVLKGSKMERKSHEPPQKYVHYQPIEDGIYSLTMTNDYMTLEYAEEFGQAITKLSQLKKMKALIIEYEDQLSKGLEPSLKEELNKTKPSKTKINEIYKIYFHCMKLANVNVPVICCLNGEITDLNILLAILSNWRLITRRSFLSSHNNPININWITELVNAKNDTQSLNLIEKIEKEKISAIQAYKLKYVNDIASSAENMKKMALEMAKSIIQNDEENPINITIEDVEKINNAIKI